jgi:glycosyltransferase involved in cell wall biosynthesis
MKAAIYNPYLDTLGGGERYTMAFAQSLSQLGYEVFVEWKDQTIKELLEKRFGIHLKSINFIEDIKRGDGYDICFWVSDGSIPLLRSRKNILHFQVPFKKVNGRTLLNKMKFMRINSVVCNSYFTKNTIDAEYGINSTVIYPPVEVHKIKPRKKTNTILYIGRFSQLEQSKNQHILVEAFRELYTHGGKDWNLVLAGGSDVGVSDYIEKLKKRAEDFPIQIIQSPPFDELKKLYGSAKIFWSAAGYGIDEIKTPRKTEHFGITVVESMAAGCVPFAYNAGGHKEIIADGENGFLWETEKELLEKTKELIDDKKRLKEFSIAAKESSYVYEYERFEAQVSQLIHPHVE